MLARWWNSVWVNPGHTAVTCTPVPASSTARLSLNTVTQALDAEYVPPVIQLATLLTLRTAPLARATIPGRAAWVSRITAVTRTSSMRCSASRSPDENRWGTPNPALLTRISIG